MKNIGFVVGLSSALLASGAAPSRAAVTLLNGSFENGPGGIGNFATYTAGNTSIVGWTINSGSIDYIESYWTAQNGLRSLDMNGLVVGGISQTITGLTNGAKYNVRFYISGNPDNGPVIKTLRAFTSGASLNASFDISNPGNSHANMGWVQKSFVFTASGPTELLSFVSTVTGGSSNPDYPAAFGPALDNVSVSAVPETSTWIMMLLGFAGLGFAGYRRDRIAYRGGI